MIGRGGCGGERGGQDQSFSPRVCVSIKGARRKTKRQDRQERQMPSLLDQRMDTALGRLVAPGAPLGVGSVTVDGLTFPTIATRSVIAAALFRAFLFRACRQDVPGRRRRAADLRAGLRRGGARRARADWRARDCQRRPRRHRDAQFAVVDRAVHGGGDGRRGRDPAQRLVAGGRTGGGARRCRLQPGAGRSAAREAAGGGARASGAGRDDRRPPAARHGARAHRCPAMPTLCFPISPRRTMRRSCSPRARPASRRARSAITAPWCRRPSTIWRRRW